ncbi:MAG TPA: hypothetical protein PK014_09800 [Thermoanaerobaculia bacterium]|nr:hypothetical protein [Thermoanaerobaculia bacterium]HUM30117.1 hypothetical protein [Thermoanaerobaculia bacterium]HXK68814.1 hypothetical protein [Thermoanaerobaculia bacterium]
MIIAFPVLDERIAPVADVAPGWILYREGEEGLEYVDCSSYYPPSYPDVLRERGVGIVICNAISPLLTRLLVLQNIQVVPGVRGTPGEVAKSLPDLLTMQPFPSGRRRMRCRRGHQRRR